MGLIVFMIQGLGKFQKKYMMLVTLGFVSFFCQAEKPEVDLFPLMRQSWPKIHTKGAPVTIRFSSPAPSMSPLPAIWQRGVEALEAHSEGAFVFRQFHNGLIHGPHFSFKAIRSGNSDFSVCYSSLAPNFFRLTTVWNLPFITPSNPLVATRIALELAPKYFRAEFQGQDVYLGHLNVFSPAQLHSKRPIRTLEELKGQRVACAALHADLFKALGAIPISIPFTDYYVGLQRGVLDAVYWTDIAAIAYKISDITKYRLQIDLSSGSLDYCIRKEFFNNLPMEFKKLFYHYNQSMALAEVYYLDWQKRPAIEQAYKQLGVTTLILEAKELKRWQALTQPFLDRWVQEAEAKGFPAQQLLKDIESLKEKYQGQSSLELLQLALAAPIPGLIEGF